METKSVERLSLLHPKIRQEALDAYAEAVKITPKGVHPYIDSTLRTFAEQEKLYNQGRTTKGPIVTKAKPGQSNHNYGFALDFHLQIDGKDVWDEKNPNWMKVVECFTKRRWEWGGFWQFKDYPHVEKTFGMNWRKMLEIHNAGKVDSEGYIIF